MTRRPDPTEYAPYYGKYVALVPEADVLAVLRTQLDDTMAFLGAIPESRAGERHPPYTWSTKEVVGHLTDTERIFGYRALRFARGDSTALPGFDQDAYARMAEFDGRRLVDVVSEFESLRRSHLWLFSPLPAEAWSRHGEASGARVSVRALAFIIAGHVRHHVGILRQRHAVR